MTIESHELWPHHESPVSRSDTLLGGRWAPPSCANYHCANRSGFLDSPFCADCMWRMWAHMDLTQSESDKQLARSNRLDELHAKAARMSTDDEIDRQWREEQARIRSMTHPGTIYYLRVGDLIKIGFTVDFGQRMRSYPPNAVLLARHPGTRETERQMHHKFLHRLAKGREWFTPCEEIDRHVESVKETFAQAA